MSAPCCVAFYGFLVEVAEDEVETLEARSHDLQRAARRLRLSFYWGNCESPAERYVALVGVELGVLGPENSLSVNLSGTDLQAAIAEAEPRLAELHPGDAPALILQWFTD